MASSNNDTGLSELDKLIHNFEFENHQLVKMIEKENQFINDLNTQIESKKVQSHSMENEICKWDSDTKRLHKQFTSNRENINNLKVTRSVLIDHELALSKQLHNLKLEGDEKRQFYQNHVEHYKSIHEEYMRKYKSFPLAVEIEKLNNAVFQKSSQFEELECVRDDLRKEIETKENFLNFRSLPNLILNLARTKISIGSLSKEIETCDSLLSQVSKKSQTPPSSATYKDMELSYEPSKSDSRSSMELEQQDISPCQSNVDFKPIYDTESEENRASSQGFLNTNEKPDQTDKESFPIEENVTYSGNITEIKKVAETRNPRFVQSTEKRTTQQVKAAEVKPLKMPDFKSQPSSRSLVPPVRKPFVPQPPVLKPFNPRQHPNQRPILQPPPMTKSIDQRLFLTKPSVPVVKQARPKNPEDSTFILRKNPQDYGKKPYGSGKPSKPVVLNQISEPTFILRKPTNDTSIRPEKKNSSQKSFQNVPSKPTLNQAQQDPTFILRKPVSDPTKVNVEKKSSPQKSFLNTTSKVATNKISEPTFILRKPTNDSSIRPEKKTSSQKSFQNVSSKPSPVQNQTRNVKDNQPLPIKPSEFDDSHKDKFETTKKSTKEDQKIFKTADLEQPNSPSSDVSSANSPFNFFDHMNKSLDDEETSNDGQSFNLFSFGKNENGSSGMEDDTSQNNLFGAFSKSQGSSDAQFGFLDFNATDDDREEDGQSFFKLF